MGCGAHARVGGCLTQNAADIDEYIRAGGRLEHVVVRAEFDDGCVVVRATR